MGISALTPPPRPEDVQETLLAFPDNRLLIDLCGQYDRNLAAVEQKLGVTIVRRGNQLAIMGGTGARLQAMEVLQGLYARLEGGKPVVAGDVDAALRMGPGGVRPEGDAGSRTLGQIDMFGLPPMEIRTRKKSVEPRTEAQKAYVQALFHNDLCFGIGPAGTGKTGLKKCPTEAW